MSIEVTLHDIICHFDRALRKQTETRVEFSFTKESIDIAEVFQASV